MTRADKPIHARRRFTDEQIKDMENMRYFQRMSFKAIADKIGGGETAESIEKQLCSHGSYTDGKPLKAPHFDGWDFRGMDIA